MNRSIGKYNLREKSYFTKEKPKFEKPIFCHKAVKHEELSKIIWRDKGFINKNVKLDFKCIGMLEWDLKYMSRWVSTCRVEVGMGLKCMDFDKKIHYNFMRDIKIQRGMDCKRLGCEIFINLYKFVGDYNLGRFSPIIKLKEWKEKEEKKIVMTKYSKWLFGKKSPKKGVFMDSVNLKNKENFEKFFSSLEKGMSRKLLVGKKEIRMGIYDSLRDDDKTDIEFIYSRTLLGLNYLVAKMRLKQRVSIIWVEGREIFPDGLDVGYYQFNRRT